MVWVVWVSKLLGPVGGFSLYVAHSGRRDLLLHGRRAVQNHLFGLVGMFGLVGTGHDEISDRLNGL